MPNHLIAGEGDLLYYDDDPGANVEAKPPSFARDGGSGYESAPVRKDRVSTLHAGQDTDTTSLIALLPWRIWPRIAHQREHNIATMVLHTVKRRRVDLLSRAQKDIMES